MLSPEDRRAIEGLFSRLAEVERRTPQRDPEAEELINREVVRQPGAPYYMAQTVLVQQHALEVAERRIRELEDEVARRDRGGLFGGLFDDGRGRQNRYQDDRPVPRSASGPWDRRPDDHRGQSGGFLAGAAQTALGVAGGVLLGNAIGSMFGAGDAHAAEAQGQDSGHGADHGQDAAGEADSGGDWGDFGGDGGGFDLGGDF